MARTLKWRDRAHELRDRVKNSVVETWSRRDIENLFELKRAAAQQLMKAIGEVQNIGGVHLVDRNSLLSRLWFLPAGVLILIPSGSVQLSRQTVGARTQGVEWVPRLSGRC